MVVFFVFQPALGTEGPHPGSLKSSDATYRSHLLNIYCPLVQTMYHHPSTEYVPYLSKRKKPQSRSPRRASQLLFQFSQKRTGKCQFRTHLHVHTGSACRVQRASYLPPSRYFRASASILFILKKGDGVKKKYGRGTGIGVRRASYIDNRSNRAVGTLYHCICAYGGTKGRKKEEEEKKKKKLRPRRKWFERSTVTSYSTVCDRLRLLSSAN